MIRLADWLKSMGIYAPIPREYLSPTYVHPSLVHEQLIRDAYQLTDSRDVGAVFEQYLNGRQAAGAGGGGGGSGSMLAHNHQLDLDCLEWKNGLGISELAAAVLSSGVDRKHLVKRVESSDNLGRKLPPRFLINGTETAVSQRIQALRNITVACKAIREGTVPASGYGSGSLSGDKLSSVSSSVARDALLTALDSLRPEDIYDGTFPIWSLLALVHAGVSSSTTGVQSQSANAGTGDGRSGSSRSRSRGRSRSRSNGLSKSRSRSRSASDGGDDLRPGPMRARYTLDPRPRSVPRQTTLKKGM